jgi:hypothetical protein
MTVSFVSLALLLRRYSGGEQRDGGAYSQNYSMQP